MDLTSTRKKSIVIEEMNFTLDSEYKVIKIRKS